MSEARLPAMRVFYADGADAGGLDAGWYYEFVDPRGPYRTAIETAAAARSEVIALSGPHWTDRFVGIRSGGADASDLEVATKIRMLQRYHPDHEAVCVVGRDRIAKLSRENRDLRARPRLPVLSPQELAAVLTGLRLYQRDFHLSQLDIEDIASASGMVEPMLPDEVDALCERLNTGAGR